MKCTVLIDVAMPREKLVQVGFPDDADVPQAVAAEHDRFPGFRRARHRRTGTVVVRVTGVMIIRPFVIMLGPGGGQSGGSDDQCPCCIA